MGLDYIILPDLSENLDGATEKNYNRLKTAGTSLEEIAQMAGSKLTIEFSEFTDKSNSPAEYLKEEYGVPFVKLPLPVGIASIDKLIAVLKEAGGSVSSQMQKERGRYLDAMVDSHKYCAEIRAAVYGEPDFVTAVIRLCRENGALPILAATGSLSPKFAEIVAAEVEQCQKYHFAEGIQILDDSDFAAIERVCHEDEANLLIGSSDGRRIARQLKIPLIRCAFPIHDYVGGQRVRTLGFEGSLNLLDQMANAMIEKTETGFRKELYEQFFLINEGRYVYGST
jgi:nitrogenase molybdenum-iron protein alpha/beta subunit